MCRPLERDLDPIASRPTDLPDRRVCEDCMSIYNTLMNACVRAEIFGPRPQSIRSADRIHRSTVDIGWREPKGSPAAAVRIYGCRSTASRHRARAPHSCLIASMIAVSRSREVSLYSTHARSTRDYLDNPRIVPQILLVLSIYWEDNIWKVLLKFTVKWTSIYY